MSEQAGERNSLETFFNEAGHGRGPARGQAVAERRPASPLTIADAGDLFAAILRELDGGATGAATAQARPERRERASAQFRETRKDEGPGLFASLGLLDENLGGVLLSWLKWGTVAAVVLAFVLYVGSGVVNWVSTTQQRNAAAQAKRDAFIKAGWRISERLGPQGSYDPDEPLFRDAAEPEGTTVGYLKEISPDDGRILFKVTKTKTGFNYELSGWVRDAAQREKAIAELADVFPVASDPRRMVMVRGVEVRPGGGALLPGEFRTIVEESGYVATPEGMVKGVNQVQYGESGYAAVDPARRIQSLVADKTWRGTEDTPTNIVTGDAPKKGEPYFVVIGGGGLYWKTDEQRERLIEKAWDRVRQAPDGGAGARGILLVYQDGGSTADVERIAVWLQGHE